MALRWLLVGTVVGSTVACDLLQSWEMKRQGEVTDFRPSRLAGLFRRWPLALSVVFMAISFFAFLRLLETEDLSFAVPATAASLVVETFLARIVLKETVDPRRWLGAILVAGGVALLAHT
jgi:drug/metabolite transporter (DMT)-like permease